MPLTTTLAGGSALIKWLLRDEFTDTRAAGAVNGTPATPGPGGRVATDTNSKLTIADGVATFAAAGAGHGDPGLWYGALARIPGRVLVSRIAGTPANWGPGWDTNQAGAPTSTLNAFSGALTRVYRQNIAINWAGGLTNDVTYTMCVILRASGSYLFIKGGAYTDWTLFAAMDGDVTGAMYPVFHTNAGGPVDVDYMRIPDELYLPTPLAYDTFTRANGALGSSEAAGPDGQTAPVKVWVSGGATWTIAGNEAVNTPTEGVTIVTDGDMENDPVTNWPVQGTPTTYEKSAAQAHGGTFSLHVVADAVNEGGRQILTATIGTWYQIASWGYRVAASAGSPQMITTNGFNVGQSVLAFDAWTQMLGVNRATGVAPQVYLRATGGAGDFYFDDASVKPLTLNTLFSGVETGTADVVCQVELDTVVEDTQAGLVLNLDDKTTPANFVIAYHDGTNAKLDKCVAGTYTSVITAATAYAAGATLVVIKEGTAYSLYYNNAKVGTTQTVSDAGIIDNTLHGMFNTYSGNQLDNFLCLPRGTNGEYDGLNRWSA